MKRTLIGIVIVIVVAVGAYAIFHKSDNNKPTTAASSSTQSSAPAVNNAVVITKTDSKLGQYLADPQGNTLYTYNGDSNGVSNCTGSCLANWPAYQDKGATTNLPADISTIKRTDNGQIQYTYKGMPLYYFASDTKGGVTGNNVENFSVAKPAASSSSSSTNSSSSNSSSSNSSSGYPY